jgi:hypothetical protein
MAIQTVQVQRKLFVNPSALPDLRLAVADCFPA